MAEHKKVLVIGGGFSGLTAAVETAEAGFEVIIVEKTPFFGGRVTQLNKYFPKLCPPNCGLEMNYKRIKNSGDITSIRLLKQRRFLGRKAITMLP